MTQRAFLCVSCMAFAVGVVAPASGEGGTRLCQGAASARPEFRSHVDFKYGSAIGKPFLWRWLWLYEFDPRIGRLISQHYTNYPRLAAHCEMSANLACWQAGVPEDDYPARPPRP